MRLSRPGSPGGSRIKPAPVRVSLIVQAGNTAVPGMLSSKVRCWRLWSGPIGDHMNFSPAVSLAIVFACAARAESVAAPISSPNNVAPPATSAARPRSAARPISPATSIAATPPRASPAACGITRRICGGRCGIRKLRSRSLPRPTPPTSLHSSTRPAILKSRATPAAAAMCS